MFFAFPVSPTLALVGSTDHQAFFRVHGLQHSNVPDEAMVYAINRQICRFAYEAVIAGDDG